MKKNTRFISMVLVVLLIVTSLTACGGDSKKGDKFDTVDTSNMSYDEASKALYEEALGDFKTYFDKSEDAKTVSEKFALQAIAEAKLLEAAVFVPNTTSGGNYSISRVARRSGSTVQWGNDDERFSDVIVTTELIKSEDQNALVKTWKEVRGTGTYKDKAKEYLKEKGYTFKDTYTYGYSSDPQTWDACATSRSADSRAIINTYDGLIQYDCENVMKPALAESWSQNEEGTVFTLKIRKGAKWFDSQGREIGEVTANDFVTGMQHVLDAAGGLEALVSLKDGGCGIRNVDQYLNGEVDFSEVGVKAVDEYTIEYTLEKPCTFFMTMLSYGVFSPVNKAFYESKGGKFGDEYQASMDDGTNTYGHTPNDIAYCGPYLVTNATKENTIIFQANPNYWNAANVGMKTITWKFNDGKDVTKAYNDTKNGVIDGCGLTTAAVEAAKKDGLFDTYSYISDTDATTYGMFFNINRAKYENFNDNTKAVSKQNDEQKKATNMAMRNVHFRRAVAFGLDYAAYNAQVVGESLKLNSIRNSYTPGDFVLLEEDVTVDINGKKIKFPKDTFYGEIVQAQIDADDVNIKVWDEKTQSCDGFVGWYNPENAKKELEKAIEQLKEKGVEISKEKPIHLDLPCCMASETYLNRCNALKQSIEVSLEGKVVIDLVECADFKEWYNAGYYTDKGSDANYSIYDVSGWGPDYGEPSTYLNTMTPDYAGYMTKCLGIF